MRTADRNIIYNKNVRKNEIIDELFECEQETKADVLSVCESMCECLCVCVDSSLCK